MNYFQDLNLDCLIELTQAPGLSAYNRAERRMFHLSKQMAGLVLPADTYGTHLHNGKTIDMELEVKNFEAAGKTLCEIWEELMIDGHPVKAEYINDAPEEEIEKFTASPLYKTRHVLETQYMTAVLKCDDKECCSQMKTAVDLFFPNRRIPALIPIKLSSTGPVPLDLNPDVYKQELTFLDVFSRIHMEQRLLPDCLKEKYGEMVPYDVYFPSQQMKVEKRICKHCKKYFSSVKSLTQHRKICKKPMSKKSVPLRKRAKKTKKKAVLSESEDELEEEEDLEEEELFNNATTIDEENNLDADNIEEVLLGPSISTPVEGSFEVIMNLREWVKSPWNLVDL